MKALSEKQPWATLIALGIKPIENRTWKLPEKYKGQRVLIHASATPCKGLKFDSHIADVLTDEQYSAVIRAHQKELAYMDSYQYGAIIGSVEIVDCVINHESIWAEKSFECTHPQKCGSWNNEQCRLSEICIHHCNFDKLIYNWELANPILFDKPIPAKGKLGFWESDVELCHICGKPTTKDYLCEKCDNFYCEDCHAVYNQFSQRDFSCCKKCAEQ